ncbi:MAG: YtxH domain-containing protein [Candidatus Levybacteria bacterium]|nr:YtxH domain-containing protein [Candidatus Levybacteria bacterium]
MEKRNNNQAVPEGGGMNGFFPGLIIGAGLILLFTTKKGKRIVKTLTEEGLEDLAKFQDMIDAIQDEDIAPEKKEETQVPKETNVIKEIPAETGEKPSKSTSRRFFKGIRKKS